MRKAALSLVLVLMMTLPGLVYSESYSSAHENDYGVYLYFDGLLKEFSSITVMLLEGGNQSSVEVEKFSGIVNSTAEEVVRYSPLGITPKAVLLSAQFRLLGDGLTGFALSRESFLRNLEGRNLVKARNDLLSMKSALEEMYSALGEISRVSLKGENNETLTFDLEEAYTDLEGLERVVAHYEEILNGLERPAGFLIYAPKDRPFLYENVTFYGYAPGLNNVTVVINNRTYSPLFDGEAFELEYSFNGTGTYEVYALAFNGTSLVKSNVLVISVQRIPTTIVAVERETPEPVIEGYLLDYLGNPLPGREVFLRIDGQEHSLLTDDDGRFVFGLGTLKKEVNVTMVFSGDKVYAGTSQTLELVPLKERLTIRILLDKKTVRAGELEVPGFINGTLEEIPLEVYVDDKLVGKTTAKGNFTISLRLEEGKHSIYVRFPGNDEFAESVSNVVEVQVTPYYPWYRLLLFLLLLASGFAGYKLLTRAPKETRGEVKPEKVPALPEIKEEKPDLVRAYRTVYKLLRRVYGLPKSVTPRELVKKLGDQNFVPELKKVTSLHERAFYGRKRLSVRDVVEGVKTAARVVVAVFVREEL